MTLIKTSSSIFSCGALKDFAVTVSFKKLINSKSFSDDAENLYLSQSLSCLLGISYSSKKGKFVLQVKRYDLANKKVNKEQNKSLSNLAYQLTKAVFVHKSELIKHHEIFNKIYGYTRIPNLLKF